MSYHVKMRFPEGRDRALTFSYDDGVKQDIRLVEILNKYGMKGTFNLNGGAYTPEEEADKHRRMTESAATKLFAGGSHEVACHAYTHPSLAEIPASFATYEMIKDREAREAQFGTIVRGMAYPNGSVSNEAAELLKACGIVYAKTTVFTEKLNLPTEFSWHRRKDSWLRQPPRSLIPSTATVSRENFAKSTISSPTRRPWRAMPYPTSPRTAYTSPTTTPSARGSIYNSREKEAYAVSKQIV